LRMLRVACAARGDRQAVLEALDHEFDAALAAADRAGVTKAERSAIEAAARSAG
jgi:coenzyme F420-reducing hydrogenase delta subunit